MNDRKLLLLCLPVLLLCVAGVSEEYVVDNDDGPPGFHILEFSKPGYSDAVTSATIPNAGDIITVNVDLFRPMTGWMNY